MEMRAHAASGPGERVRGRSWMVRLDPVGRGSSAVRFSCVRPACPEQRLPSVAAGRALAVAHLTAHLRAAGEPRSGVYCACRADGCRGHAGPAAGGRDTGAAAWRCGGPVVFVVVADRAGRWWQALECCARCAAAHPSGQVAATAPPAGPARASGGAGPVRAAVAPRPRFSDAPGSADRAAPGGASPADPAGVPKPPGVPVPSPRPRAARPYGRHGKIAQRVVPHELRPTALRDELTELGDQFRAYQKRAEPDLALLADLHTRKARAFHEWAEVTGDAELRAQARRAEQAAVTVRGQHLQRTGHTPDGQETGVPRVLPGPQLWEHARAVLGHVRDHAPLPGPEARLLCLLLTLRTARSGSGNLTGQDVAALPLSDPGDLVGRLAASGWLWIECTAEEVLASRPENPTVVTVPSLVPGPDGERVLAFGKNTRARLSGWAQRVMTDRRLRKKRTTAAARLLALALATRTGLDGEVLGPGGEGVDTGSLAALYAGAPGDLPDLVAQLTAADWLAEAEVSGDRLIGRLSERVWPLSCPLPEPYGGAGS
ncbi:hypothetical protein AB0E75_27480 [Streptomyces griseoviridis]|uniref:Post-SET domain-containing protein n=1 Tax=Streptomyces griseoviridis TaxID=45398 RepID=A0A918GVS2_STRGD|nr:hypothetical protein [Streptomyces niveoruber]GGS62281.1 hypothetical protein GCM10010238_59200 [Streptomyces niveoruber]